MLFLTYTPGGIIMRRFISVQRMNERVEQLIEAFDDYVETFNDRNVFTGPCLYFHSKSA